MGAPPDAGGAPDLTAPPDLFVVSGPSLLSETGLYANFGSRTLAPGVIEFAPRYPQWSDGAESARWLLLPPGARIDTSDMDEWVFPVGTRIWKQFTVRRPDDGASVLVETRLLWKRYPGREGWWQVAYLWRADGSDADATPDGAEDPLGVTHCVPSQEDCVECHGNHRDAPIGVSAIQLSSPDGKSGTLTRLAAQQLLSDPPPTEYQPPGDGTVRDALGYLHGNCGHCHTDDWKIGGLVRLRLRLVVGDLQPERTRTYLTAMGGRMNHDMPVVGRIGIVPGDPAHSQLYARLGHREDGWEMPPDCTDVVDPDGMRTIRDWILELR